MNPLEVLFAFWQSLSQSVGGDAVAIIVVAVLSAAMTALYVGVQAFRRTEFYKQHQAAWELIDDRIADLIWLVEFADIDLKPYETEANQRLQDGKSYIDPRMLYLLHEAERWTEDRLGFEVDLDELLARAEHIFDEVKNSEGNGVGIPSEPEDPPADNS